MNADAIVKALKCCNVPSGRACSECPYHEVGEKCRTQRNKDAIELILELVDERRRCLEALSELADNIGLLKDKERADTVRTMQEKLEKEIDRTIDVFDFQISECNAIRRALRGVKNDIYQIAKEVLEEN